MEACHRPELANDPNGRSPLSWLPWLPHLPSKEILKSWNNTVGLGIMTDKGIDRARRSRGCDFIKDESVRETQTAKLERL